MHLIATSDDTSTALLGGKAAALARFADTGLPVPEWFVVTPEAFTASLNDLARHQLATTDAAEVTGLLASLEPVEAVRQAIVEKIHAIATNDPAALWAVRSSAVDEDGGEHSFAGQLESFLAVPSAQVAARVADVWRSGFSTRVYSYRQERGLAGPPQPPAVLVQRFIDAEVSGVAFSADPVSGARGIAVISALPGLGTALVSGEGDADVWRIDRNGLIRESRIATKTFSHRSSPAKNNTGGIRKEENTPGQQTAPCLDTAAVARVAALARQAAAFFGRPQDIEWAMRDGQLWLLQSRPITSLAGIPDPDGAPNLWDNSNIAESYNGVTTPLTYSFARGIYEEVYRQFCRILGVTNSRIEANREIFSRMLGLIHGRIYYNLASWYRVLALLPGYAMNSRFMEQMMGVKEPLPERYQPRAVAVAPWQDMLALGQTLAGLLWNHFTLPASIRRFHARLDQALAPNDTALETLRPDELAAQFRNMEAQLLTRWDAPLVNDFFAMIFYGVLRKLCTRWCDDTDETLQNNLLCGEGGMISAEPARRVRHMAEMASVHPKLISALCDGTATAAKKAMRTVPEFSEQFTAYLNKFGERCIGELKLESLTLHEDPLPLLRSIGRLARSGAVALPDNVNHEKTLRTEAEERVAEKLKSRPIRRRIFHWVLRQARNRVRDRENLRFERTRLFGRVRRIFLELGKRFTAEGKLADPRDVFYLTTTEALGFVEGTAVSADLRGTVTLRQKEFAAYRAMPPPSDRFETTGAVHLGNTFQATVPPEAPFAMTPDDDTARHGTGCCPGVVRGRARVILQPEGAVIEPGEILVAPRTDPGWIMLFPAAAGLLVEHGSLLSHAAIVTREMGIPSVVALPDITQWLKTGDWIELDGRLGTVRKLESESAS